MSCGNYCLYQLQHQAQFFCASQTASGVVEVIFPVNDNDFLAARQDEMSEQCKLSRSSQNAW